MHKRNQDARILNARRAPLAIDDENATLRSIMEGTAASVGNNFFKALVENLAGALNTYSAWISELLDDQRQLRTLAIWRGGAIMENIRFDIAGTPCETVVKSTTLVHHPDNVINFYPRNTTLRHFKAVSYIGAPLLDGQGTILGNLAVLDRRAMPSEPRAMTIFNIFAARASAELQRLRAEQTLKKSEEKYRRIIETTGEGFLLLDREFTIIDVNAAFCRMVGFSREEVLGQTPLDFAAKELGRILAVARTDLFTRPYRAFEGAVLTKTGQEIAVRVHGDILRDDRGELIGYMSFVGDISRQKTSLALAAEVQKNLLPTHNPRLEGYDIAGHSLSCEEIGGDYYDFLSSPNCGDGHLNVVVGDVTGHGVEAALLMTTVRTHMRLHSDPCGAIQNMVTAINRHLAADVLDSGRFMTLFAIQLNPRKEEFTWVRAGHGPAIIYDPLQDQFRALKGKGLALGVDRNYQYEVNRSDPLTAGQVIAIGTDGIWEAAHRNGGQYGMERFAEVIRTNAHESADTIVAAVFKDLNRFSYGVRQSDDITLVVIKRLDGKHSPHDWVI